MKCFANQGFYCSALKIKTLKEGKHCVNCNFKKSQEEVDESREKVLKRISKLDKVTRANINEKYFKGDK